MVTVREDGFFHLRGRHVQHAHGRNSTTEGEHLTGAMIALIPTEEDAQRLRVGGGEKAADLHLTLYFLGEGEDWPTDEQQSLVNSLIDLVSEERLTSVTGRVFGINHWNGGGDSPCWVLAVGDMRGEDNASQTLLEAVRDIVTNVLAENSFYVPEQFSPWVPHICMAYTDDLSLAAELQKRIGEVEFDRIRVAFGGEFTDISFGGSLTAAAPPLRRNPTPLELRARTDFARMQSEWESAVDAVWGEIQPIREAQRAQLVESVRMAAELDDLDMLTSITLDDEGVYTALLQHMTRAANEAGQAQQEEAENQGVEVGDWNLDNMTAAAGLDLLRSVARVSARVINSSFVQSAVRRALSVVGRPAVSPEQAASEVNESLSELSEAGPRESIGGAITSAQNEGRRAVLSASPPASEYVASEILDQNVCAPCRTIDGTNFETQADADEAYPSGGYRDCLGGARCRGTIVAVWDTEE